MPLTDMQVFSRTFYTTQSEILTQRIDMFNGATNGAIRLTGPLESNVGDYTTNSFFPILDDVILRRDPRSDAAIPEETLREDVNRTVKVASGTKLLGFDFAQFDWNLRPPDIAGAYYGEQLAMQRFKDLLSMAIRSLYAAMRNDDADLRTNVTGATAPNNLLNPVNMIRASSKFGYRADIIQAWILHSKPFYDFQVHAAQNPNSLFSWGGINVQADAVGRPLIYTDESTLVDITNPSVPIFHILGLTDSAVTIQDNRDWRDEEQVRMGRSNLKNQYQAEWTNQLGVKGYRWNDTTGGPAPNNAALGASANWERIVTSHKDLPGVILEVN